GEQIDGANRFRPSTHGRHIGAGVSVGDPSGRRMETFRITQSRRMCERVVLISATGRIDASGARQLRQMIDRVLTARNLSRLVVDLTRVNYLSPRGVGTLLRARDLSAQFAIDLRL